MGNRTATGNGAKYYSTQTVAPQDQFDYWKTLFGNIDLRRNDEANKSQFEAELMRCGGEDGISLVWGRSARTQARFSRESMDGFILSFTLDGEAHIRHGHDGTLIAGSQAGMVLIDCQQALRTSLPGSHTHVYLTLPRQLVLTAAGSNPIRSGDGVQNFSDLGLVPFLKNHMHLFCEHWENLTRDDIASALRIMSDLAFACLRNSQLTNDDQRPSNRALVASARMLMERRCGDNELTAEMIAAALGCSRAHLYRAFASQAETVYDMLRTIRLDRARKLITERPNMPMSQIAQLSGYESQAAFSRSFRAHFGVSPSECRMMRV